MILLFHQGGGNARGEYGPIIPRLLREGYSLLAIDQRSGGERFGGKNRTVAALGNTDASYCDACADLRAALHFVRHQGFAGRLVAWGSSYSASLAIRLGAEYPTDVVAVVAFSPAAGGPMESCEPDSHIAKLRVPLLVLRPASEMSLEVVRRQGDVLAQHGHEVYVAENGIHGSSLLVPDRVKGDVEPHWRRVLAFIRAATHVVAQTTVDSLRALDSAWARAYAVHDTSLGQALFAEDLVVTSVAGALKDKRGELADIRAQPNLQMAFFRTNDVSVRVHDRAAVVTGLAEWRFTVNGNTSDVRRRYTSVWIAGGPLGWRMVALHMGRAP